MDATAIRELQDSAVAAHTNTALSTLTSQLVALPNGYKLHNLEQHHQHPFRFSGGFETTVLPDFVKYVKSVPDIGQYGPPTVFISPHHARATAYFNLGNPEAPGHGDHWAALDMPATPEWEAMRNAASIQFSQQELIEWLENWQDNVQPLTANDDAMPLKQAIAAIRTVTIKAASEMTNTEDNFRQSRSMMENIEASSRVELPAFVDFRAEPYLGQAPITVCLRVSVLTGGEKPMFRLRPIALEKAETEALTTFASRLMSELGDGPQVYIGTFSP